MLATTSLFFDKYHIKKNGESAIYVRVTFERKKKYYKTKWSLTASDFEIIKSGNPKKELKEIAIKLDDYEKKAYDIIKDMSTFTFERFEDLYFSNRAAKEYVEIAFNEYIKILNNEDRIGTAVSYQTTINSLLRFKKELKFQDITIDFLRKYEHWMTEGENKSISTVGIYLRSLRTIFNINIAKGLLSKETYPFRKNGYEIPTSKNKKKAITVSQVGLIYNYKAVAGSKEEKYRDYWFFMYLCNGMNTFDMCLLKYKNIDGETIKFLRKKTKRTKREVTTITVYLHPETNNIIQKWGNKMVTGDTFIFPELQEDLNKVNERKLVQQLSKTIGKYMKVICKNLDLNVNLTVAYARHSYATVMKRGGNSLALIGDSMGHSSPKTTINYLDSFEDDAIAQATKSLTAFSKES